MSDLTITAANVRAGTGASRKHVTAGASVTAGQVVYEDTADNQHKLADCDNASALVRSPSGIALHASLDEQPLAIHTGGPITIGATLVPGTTYYLSATPGGICPFDDLAAGDYPVIVGIAISTTVLDVKFHEAGVALS